VFKVVGKTGGLSLTSYPSPLSPPSVYHPTPHELGAKLRTGGAEPPPCPLTLSPGEYDHRTDGQTDGRTADRYITLSAIRGHVGQGKNVQLNEGRVCWR